jgi:hypothetical protein
MSIEFARANFRADNIRYQPWDLAGAAPHLCADVFVAFEILEHLDDPQRLINSIHGLLLWSVPMHDGSKFHKHVYSEERARREFGGRIWWQDRAGTVCAEKPEHGATINLIGALECG